MLCAAPWWLQQPALRVRLVFNVVFLFSWLNFKGRNQTSEIKRSRVGGSGTRLLKVEGKVSGGGGGAGPPDPPHVSDQHPQHGNKHVRRLLIC